MAGETQAGASEQAGSILRLTTLSPVLPKRLAALHRRLAFVAWAPGVGRPLLDVATIHCARWIVFGSLPHPGGNGRAWPLNWKYLLFAATYDKPEDAYLNTFADILPLRLAAVFGDCFGFQQLVENAPGADGRVFAAYAFRDFVLKNRLKRLDDFGSVTDTVLSIRQALAIKRAVRGSDLLSGAALQRVESAVNAMALGPPPAEPGYLDAARVQWSRLARPARSVRPLTVVAPLESEWKQVESQMWNKLPDTLFVRLEQVPRTMQEELGQQNPDRLPTNYLLFMSDYYGKRSDYIEALRGHQVTTPIFKQCVGFPGTKGRQRFYDWIASHSLKTQYYVTGYAVPPIDELTSLLKAREQVARWCRGEIGPGARGA